MRIVWRSIRYRGGALLARAASWAVGWTGTTITTAAAEAADGEIIDVPAHDRTVAVAGLTRTVTVAAQTRTVLVPERPTP